MKKITEATVEFQEAIRNHIEELTSGEGAFELKTYEKITNCVTIKYNKHVITDVYYTTSGIRLSTKSIFFTDKDLSDKANAEELCTTFENCNLIKNVTDFQIRTSDLADLKLVEEKGKAYFDAKAQAKAKKAQEKEEPQETPVEEKPQEEPQEKPQGKRKGRGKKNAQESTDKASEPSPKVDTQEVQEVAV